MQYILILAISRLFCTLSTVFKMLWPASRAGLCNLHDGKIVSGLSNTDRISSEFQKPLTLDLIQWKRSLFLLGNFHVQRKSFCHLSQESCNYARLVLFHLNPVTISKTNHNILVENANGWKKVFAAPNQCKNNSRSMQPNIWNPLHWLVAKMI